MQTTKKVTRCIPRPTAWGRTFAWVEMYSTASSLLISNSNEYSIAITSWEPFHKISTFEISKNAQRERERERELWTFTWSVSASIKNRLGLLEVKVESEFATGFLLRFPGGTFSPSILGQIWPTTTI